MSNLDIFDTNEIYVSSYIPVISFQSQAQKEIAKSYMREEADDFFKNILKINRPIQCIPYAKTISRQDFNEIDIKYFYETLFFDLCERDSRGKLINNLKWGVTFDAEMAPIQTASINKEANLNYLDNREGRPSLRYHSLNPSPLYRRYGVITLNGEAVFYYLYFTLQEMLDAIKRKQTEI